MKKKDGRGGARVGAGAKPKKESERHISVATYHKVADIEKIGGMEAAREVASGAINRKIKKF